MIALAVVIVVGVYYIVFDVMQYHVTSQPFAVTVLMPSAGGLYSGADVTYRGVQVGTVTALDLDPGNVAVKLGDRRRASTSPTTDRSGSRSSRPWASSTSTCSRPRGSGPDLHSGTVIPADRVVLPTPIGTALVDLGTMLKSINPQDLRPTRTSWPAPSSAPDRISARSS